MCASRITSLERKSRPISVYECLEDRGDSIEDLCSFVKTFCDSNNIDPKVTEEGIGILRSEQKKYKLETPTNSKKLHISQSTVSLEELTSPRSTTLSRRDRISLALRLSYAILQYYKTGWIDDSWTWRDFSMATTEDQKPDESHLFVTQRFYSSSTKSSEIIAPDRPVSGGFWEALGEPRLTRLGFALIELALGKRLAELRDKSYDGMDPDMVDFCTARNLLRSGRIMREEGRAYHEVVWACIEHQFLCRSEIRALDSRQPTFHQDVEQSILTPLHCMFTETWGESRKQLVY